MIQPIGGCSTDSNCPNGYYCSSNKQCVEYGSSYCYHHDCGEGDGGSCKSNPFAALMAQLSDVSVALERVDSVGLAHGEPNVFA